MKLFSVKKKRRLLGMPTFYIVQWSVCWVAQRLQFLSCLRLELPFPESLLHLILDLSLLFQFGVCDLCKIWKVEVKGDAVLGTLVSEAHQLGFPRA